MEGTVFPRCNDIASTPESVVCYRGRPSRPDGSAESRLAWRSSSERPVASPCLFVSTSIHPGASISGSPISSRVERVAKIALQATSRAMLLISSSGTPALSSRFMAKPASAKGPFGSRSAARILLLIHSELSRYTSISSRHRRRSKRKRANCGISSIISERAHFSASGASSCLNRSTKRCARP
jgi:hypothetical protein